MRRASYRAGIFWLAHNDDTEWVDAEFGSPSVTACLLADLFGVTTERVTADLKRELAKAQAQSNLVLGQCPECYAINRHEAGCSRGRS